MKLIIDKEECRPLSDDIQGKLVVIKSDFFKPEFRETKYQLALATGGFGCNVKNIGNAVFVIECCENPEHYRQKRYNLIGEPTEEMITEWKAAYGDFNEEVLKKMEELAISEGMAKEFYRDLCGTVYGDDTITCGGIMNEAKIAEIMSITLEEAERFCNAMIKYGITERQGGMFVI